MCPTADSGSDSERSYFPKLVLLWSAWRSSAHALNSFGPRCPARSEQRLKADQPGSHPASIRVCRRASSRNGLASSEGMRTVRNGSGTESEGCALFVWGIQKGDTMAEKSE